MVAFKGKRYAEKKDAGAALACRLQSHEQAKLCRLASIGALRWRLSRHGFSREFKVAFIGELRHTVALGTDIFGNIQRLTTRLESVPGQARRAEQRKHETQMENAKIEVKPFRGGGAG